MDKFWPSWWTEQKGNTLLLQTNKMLDKIYFKTDYSQTWKIKGGVSIDVRNEEETTAKWGSDCWSCTDYEGPGL